MSLGNCSDFQCLKRSNTTPIIEFTVVGLVCKVMICGMCCQMTKIKKRSRVSNLDHYSGKSNYCNNHRYRNDGPPFKGLNSCSKTLTAIAVTHTILIVLKIIK